MFVPFRYSPKFVAYLARLLINYDYASLSWWERRTMNPPTSGEKVTGTVFKGPRYLGLSKMSVGTHG
jgi:hypothetical protein